MTNPNDDRTIPQLNLVPGSTVAQYTILEKLGAGGMGEVFLATDTKLGRKVALKFLPANLAQLSELRTRFLREARAAAGLDHPNIVTVYEAGEIAGRPFIAMQHVLGRTLDCYCGDGAEGRALTMQQLLSLSAALADGLAKAHEAGVVHRDIKPTNIIVDDKLRPTIVDFGLAAVGGSEALTQDGVSMGTPAYMSPEQVRGERVDFRSDLFSLGVVMYQMITGRSPFKRESTAAVQQAILTKDPEPLARYKSHVPRDVQRVVSRCLAKDPKARYASAKDLAAELRYVWGTISSGAVTAHPPQAREEPSVAVLPFANMSADPENEFFSDGLTEELLNVLAQNVGLKVTGRTSSFAFKGKPMDMREIGQKLGVKTLLEGSVRKAGNRVRITAQLINAADGFHLWSETYDRVLEDIFAVQDDIAHAVAEALNITLLGEPSAPRTANAQTYELLLRANHASQQMSEIAVKRAVELFEQVLAVEPNNANALAGLARALGLCAAYGYLDAEPATARALEVAGRALELDAESPDAHEILGWLCASACRQDEALEHFRRAYAAAPGNSRVVSSYAKFQAMRLNFDEAFPLAARAVELDPLNAEALANQGRIFVAAERMEEALPCFERAKELSPHISLSIWFSLTLFALGDKEGALRAAQEEPKAGYRYFGLAKMYHLLGRHQESDEAMARLLQESEDWAFQFACAHAVRGEKDEAFAWLERAAANHDAGIPALLITLALRNLHDDPRWDVLTKKLGFK